MCYYARDGVGGMLPRTFPRYRAGGTDSVPGALGREAEGSRNKAGRGREGHRTGLGHLNLPLPSLTAFHFRILENPSFKVSSVVSCVPPSASQKTIIFRTDGRRTPDFQPPERVLRAINSLLAFCVVTCTKHWLPTPAHKLLSRLPWFIYTGGLIH